MKIIKNLQEYKEFIQSTYDDFKCDEDWMDFFGFELKWDEDTGEILETIEEYQGEIKLIPKSFPCVLSYECNKLWNRLGGDYIDYHIDFMSLDEIRNELFDIDILKMRNLTKEEQDSLYKSLEEINVDTGIQLFNL